MTLLPVSTLTKLDVINRVLQEAGERPVDSVLDNGASWKVAGLLPSAISQVNEELPWEELFVNKLLDDASITTEQSISVLNNFIGYRLESDYSDLVDVLYLQNNVTSKPVQYREWFKFLPLTYSVAELATQYTYFRGLLYTYPQLTEEARGAYSVGYLGSVKPPVEDSDTFAAPDYLVELYIKRLLYQFSQRHLNNTDLTNLVFQEYVSELQKHSARYNTLPKTLRSGYSVPNASVATTSIPSQ